MSREGLGRRCGSYNETRETREIRGRIELRLRDARNLVVALVIAAAPAAAVDTLVVGTGELDWLRLEHRATHVQVVGDSVWTWNTSAGRNLVPSSAQRGGGVRVNTNYSGGYHWEALPGIELIGDGDPGTAWAPDVDDRVERQAELEIDLGAVFGVDRLRFHPRLDQEHRDLLLGDFAVRFSETAAPHHASTSAPSRQLFGFSAFYPNREPLVERVFPPLSVRYLYLIAREREQWELAEFQVFGDGTAPAGEFLSKPVFVRGGYPVWGHVWSDLGEVADLPLVLQTRTGPDDEPEHYFLQRGDELEKVSREDYLSLGALPFETIEVIQGPIRPNPEWSTWQTVSDGLVQSPAPRRYLQFRLLLTEPGLCLRRLFFEYAKRPPAAELLAEINPLVVPAGEPTEFTLSLEIRVDQGRGDTGFRFIQVRTAAVAVQVYQVLVDDREAVYTVTYDEGYGFTINLWRRVLQSGSYVQVVFRATVLRDGTAFQVRAQDVRPIEDEIEQVYQTASAADVEPLSVGGELVVRLESTDEPVVEALTAVSRVFSPNGDGVNDVLTVAYSLMKLTQPVPVEFEIFSLDGQRVRRGRSQAQGSGQYCRVWDGLDDRGQRVPTGTFLYRVRADTDIGAETLVGTVSVVY